MTLPRGEGVVADTAALIGRSFRVPLSLRDSFLEKRIDRCHRSTAVGRVREETTASREGRLGGIEQEAIIMIVHIPESERKFR